MAKSALRKGLVVGLMLVVSSCTHKPNPTAELAASLQPFTSTRDEAVAAIAFEKHQLGPDDLNTLTVAYTRLQEKANAYAGFIVEAVTAVSFDDAANDRYAADLSKAIPTYNGTFRHLAGAKAAALPNDWIPGFSNDVKTKWLKYRDALQHLTPQQQHDLVIDIKRKTVWPNYEDVATPPLSPAPLQ